MVEVASAQGEDAGCDAMAAEMRSGGWAQPAATAVIAIAHVRCLPARLAV
jgi:hypothetical protein